MTVAMNIPVRAISENTLQAAVTQGLLSAEQAQRLRDLEVAQVAASEPEDDEKLRFISGFGDIFVTIGLALFLGALGYFAHEAFSLFGTAAILAVTAWGLAEFFTRTRRMALPSIALLIVYAAAVFLAFYQAFDILTEQAAGFRPGLGFGRLRFDDPLALAGAALVTVAGAALHYWRFRVPITIAAGTLALVGAVVGLLFTAAPDFVEYASNFIVLVCGLAVFALAMRFDMSDPLRVTRRTDIAFWLHLVAAPMIVHPLIRGFAPDSGMTSTASAWGILAVFSLLAVVAVVVDRRAVLVSGLSYAGFAFASLVGASGLIDGVVPLTVLVLGAVVLVLSAGWHRLRGLLLGLLPPTIALRLPGSHLRHLQT
ncbi:hypothetical protein MAXJ12_03862 [Mesorhizobium alhagi CCNWXJ12-2]|jgi:hypothetical protein|uniref:DUF2157 domain-containing protein n=2 Tax=Allomesorhizobium alhagi TaxID=475067 RepID=H0HKW4_9HYPH|nr:hypothetical protein MAXJ12_03862 [Mesorhizobium alhagi CCNWXJ12-2]